MEQGKGNEPPGLNYRGNQRSMHHRSILLILVEMRTTAEIGKLEHCSENRHEKGERFWLGGGKNFWRVELRHLPSVDRPMPNR
jgi:hypothetical protein